MATENDLIAVGSLDHRRCPTVLGDTIESHMSRSLNRKNFPIKIDNTVPDVIVSIEICRKIARDTIAARAVQRWPNAHATIFPWSLPGIIFSNTQALFEVLV